MPYLMWIVFDNVGSVIECVGTKGHLVWRLVLVHVLVHHVEVLGDQPALRDITLKRTEDKVIKKKPEQSEKV